MGNVAFITKLAGFEYTKFVAPNLTEKGIPLFKGKNIKNSELVLDFESYIPEQISNELSRSQITKKCILTPYVGTIGNIAIFDGKFKAHLGSNVGKIELINSTKSIYMLEEYVLIYLKSSPGYMQLTKYKKATAQESISIDAIRNVLIPIPPYNEQNRIVAKLQELEPLIQKYQKTEEQLYELNSNIKDQLKKSILQYAIEGKLVPQDPNDEPASALLERIRKEKQKLIAVGKIKKDKNETIIYRRDNSYYEKQNGIEKCIDDEIPFEIPDTWEWCRFNQLFKLTSGQDLSTDKFNSACKGIPYITGASNLENGSVIINRWTTEPKSFSYSGDLLLTCKGTIGKIAFLTVEKAHIARQIMSIASPYKINLHFIKLILNLNIINLKAKAKSMIPGISRDDVLSILIPVPPLNEQDRIVLKLQELEL